MSQDSVATPPPAPAEVSLSAAPLARSAWWIPAAALGAGIAIGAIGTLAIGGDEAETSASVPPPPTERGIALPEALAQRAGIEVQPVRAEPVVPTIEIVGNVAFDPARIADVGGRLEGRVVEVHVELGDRVEPGDPLVSIEGPDLGQAIAELLEARAELAAATSQAERQATLRRDQLTTATAHEQAAAERAALEARVRGAEQHLAALGLAPGSITAASRGRPLPRTITLRSPIAGEVVERQVHLGAVVDPTHPLVRIADLSSVWIVLNMFENDLGRVRVGDRVEIVSEAYPDEVLPGTVAHVGATVDEATRTADVRVVVDNTDRRLRPGQFVHATLHVSSEAQREALLLPQSAISQVAGQPSVFVRIGENRYDVRPLELGPRYGTRVEVRRGLAPGDEVVVEGAFALKSELER
ncbi:MAG: efflux RND transporter periplasmic adaptor subunit [Sandaracinaceae bacterium]